MRGPEMIPGSMHLLVYEWPGRNPGDYFGGTVGTDPVNTYAKSVATTPMIAISSTLCLMVNLKRRLSSADAIPVAATATAIL